jgi:CPA1 family monovalent cation:H+ antiporter
VLGYALARIADDRRWRATLLTFWSLIDDLLNTLLYMLIGFEVLVIDPGWQTMLATLLAVPLALLVRLFSVAGPMSILDLGVPHTGRAIGIVTWAGLRGGVSIALALIVPESPYRTLLLTICLGVVIFTVVVQGLLLQRVATALSAGREIVQPPGPM